MKSFTSAMFVSGAVAALAPYPYPAASSSSAVYYATGGAPVYPVESAPYPYATKSVVYQTTCSTEAGYYSTETAKASTYYNTDKHNTESKVTYSLTAPVYVTKTYEYENQKPTDVITKTVIYTTGTETLTKTIVVVVPTKDAKTETVVVVQPTAPVYTAPVVTAPAYTVPAEATETKNVFVTAPAAPYVCPAVSTVTEVVKQYITVTQPAADNKPTPYAPVEDNKPSPYGSTVIVTPVKPTAPAVYQPANPSYAPAQNGTTSQVIKPTYSAPVQYTGSAAKSAAGFGGLAIAALAFIL